MRTLPAIATLGLLGVSALPCAGTAVASRGGSPRQARATAGRVSCGETIVTNTKLDRDLVNCPNNGIVIGADNVTLDLNGHVIDGDGTEFSECVPGEECDLGVLTSGHDGVTIKGGAVSQFTFGVLYFNASHGRLTRLELSDNLFSGLLVVAASQTGIDGITASANGLTTDQAGIDVFDSHDLTIANNVVTANGDIGFFISGLENSRIEKNSVSRNSESGILLDAGSGNALTQNQISSSGDAIVVSGDANTVSANRLSGAACAPVCNGFGVSLEGGTGNVIEANLVSHFPVAGIRVASFESEGGPPTVGNSVSANVVRDSVVDGVLIESTAADTLLQRNIATGSGDDGFDIQSATTTLTRNLAVHNGDLGIDSVAGVADGGGNKAFANGNPVQCTNVKCQ